MMRHRDQGVFWPAAEPVHSAAADQAGKLQGSVAEFFTNLVQTDEGKASVKVSNGYANKTSFVAGLRE